MLRILTPMLIAARSRFIFLSEYTRAGTSFSICCPFSVSLILVLSLPSSLRRGEVSDGHSEFNMFGFVIKSACGENAGHKKRSSVIAVLS